MVPSQYITLLELEELAQYDFRSMEIMLSAGAPLRVTTKKAIRDRLDCRLMELYGVTEGPGTVLNPEDMEDKIGSVGRPILGADIRIVDADDRELARGEIGEIVGYCGANMKGYHKRPDKTAETIWEDEQGRTYVRTGDIGRLDEDGFLYVLDRKKDMIISGGINIFASDLEEVISKHADVQEVAVIGIPHDKWGETPLALVIPHERSDTSPDQIRDWANSKLGKYQRVTAVDFRDSLPRNALGKVLKRELREPYLKNS